VLGISAGPAVAGERHTTTKTVSYDGYQVTVPASWPVFDLNTEPARCVRYDVHAVYLGNPGPDQLCPPHLVGRTDTVSIGSPAAFQRAAVTAQPALPGTTGGEQVRALPSLNAAIMLDSSSHQLRVAMRSVSDAVITATYGTSPGDMARLLATLRRAPVRTRAARPARVEVRPAVLQVPAPARLVPVRPAPAPVPVPTPALAAPVVAPAPVPLPAPVSVRLVPDQDVIPDGDGTIVITIPSETITLPEHQPDIDPTPTSAPTPTPVPPGPPHPVAARGFDTCTAPSLRAMRAWRAKYAVVGVYIGGSNMACDYGNLSASWVRAATRMGWGLLPTYVGPQAPCYGAGDMINPRHAAAQGQAAGLDAAMDAAAFGLPAHSPVYYDMEAYDEANPGCVTGVLRFLSAFTKALNSRGYVSGVYSSADSGILDLQSAAALRTMTEPQAIWFALWDGKPSLIATQVLKAHPWAVTQRVKQFAGSHLQRIGGFRLDIDSDLVGGPVAR
jgi:hypothetical protein